ncbi:hypothetical protein IU479_34450 [Nocardia abscessus]|uniref:hypothetical protein n=1 Tax=Nocardia TaxID=1817 RepID=UPI001892E587|nr:MULTISPECIES: hypothetical protein [Nocardia]MBF6223179.1 hypothetical protein [Nocardia abscessus]MDE1674430.1 hypothetical protein [Nocardia gipuzkoensis]
MAVRNLRYNEILAAVLLLSIPLLRMAHRLRLPGGIRCDRILCGAYRTTATCVAVAWAADATPHPQRTPTLIRP